MVSDGVSANNQYIDATVEIVVNEDTVVVIDDDLPTDVVAAMVDHDGDEANRYGCWLHVCNIGTR